jgi:hypothetical protein
VRKVKRIAAVAPCAVPNIFRISVVLRVISSCLRISVHMGRLVRRGAQLTTTLNMRKALYLTDLLALKHFLSD